MSSTKTGVSGLGTEAGMDRENASSKFSNLIRFGKVLLEVKSLGGDAKEILGALSGTLVLSRVPFLVVTILAGIVTSLLILCALVIGLTYVF